MIRKKLLFLLVTVILMIPSFSVFAASGVYDDAGLFYETEITSLNMELEDLSALTGWDVAVVTTDDAQGKSAVVYADDYYAQIGFGDNGIIYLLDMDNREIYISTAGAATDYLTDSRLNNIFDTAANFAAQRSYYQAMSVQISMTSDYFNAGIPIDQAAAAAKITVVAAAVIIGIIAAVITVVSIIKSYSFKETGNIYEYSSKSRVNLTVNSDKLVNSFITTRIRPKPKNNSGSGRSGGSSTHRSSSGRIHGGGGRKF